MQSIANCSALLGWVENGLLWFRDGYADQDGCHRLSVGAIFLFQESVRGH